MRAMRNGLVAIVLLGLAACGGGTPSTTNATTPSGAATDGKPAGSAVPEEKVTASAEAKAIVAAADRDEEDRKLDAGRKPAEMLTFYGVKPGMKVADLAAGGGYTTEILARAVGPSGVVYSQNNKMVVEKFAGEPWNARLAKPVNKNVVKVVREFDDPLPPEAKDVDAVFIVLTYHDLYWFGADRAKMNAAVMRALKPGGVYAIIDHSGRPGTGATEVQTVHRIEEKELVGDVTKAGFRLARAADFLRNPNDTRDWNPAPMAAGPRRGSSDRFVLAFVKP